MGFIIANTPPAGGQCPPPAPPIFADKFRKLSGRAKSAKNTNRPILLPAFSRTVDQVLNEEGLGRFGAVAAAADV